MYYLEAGKEMNIPVVLIVFNRPDTTQSVFDIIRKMAPKKLFIVSDAARDEKGIYEKKLVSRVRNICKQIDWKCNAHTKYATKNLGCRKAVSYGLDWVFSHVDRAIILEDDCIPDTTFFRFCEELLVKYNANEKIMMISGNNFLSENTKYSYDFCKHSLIWGWATWRRAWVQYRKAEKKGLKELAQKFDTYASLMSPIRLSAIQKTLSGKIDTWDYIWQMALLMQDGLCVYPFTNLVRNIGFGPNATHTKYVTLHASKKANPMRFPLIHPNQILQNMTMDKYIEKTYQPLNMLWDIACGFILQKNKRH
ncbi:MAG: glycosyltransferase family 2 protein [Patescibacteria group bacterium]